MLRNPVNCSSPGEGFSREGIREYELETDYSFLLSDWRESWNPLMRLWRKRRVKRAYRKLLEFHEPVSKGRFRQELLCERQALSARNASLVGEILAEKRLLRRPPKPPPVAVLSIVGHLRTFFLRHDEMTPDPLRAGGSAFPELMLALSRFVADFASLSPEQIAPAARHIVFVHRVHNALSPLLARLATSGLSPDERRCVEAELRSRLTRFLGGPP